MMPNHNNIYLVGPMGVGKSTVGKRLAERTGKQFVDADQKIEERTGVTIDVIFEIEGEAGFRRRESRMLAELTELQNIVLATGGGAVLDPENRRRLRNSGTIIYLSAEAEVLAQRMSRDRNRPLLQTDDRLSRIRELLSVRAPLYRELADCTIDTGRESVGQSVDRICRELELECAG